jgi:hypothetical protein
MSIEIKTEIQLQIGHVLFMDIVGYSMHAEFRSRSHAAPVQHLIPDRIQ